MKYTSISDEQMELIETVLTDWEKQEMSEIAPRTDMLHGLREVRFRAIDVPRKYNEDRPWETETEDAESLVYAINEELERDAVPRETNFGCPTIVETAAEYDDREEALERLHDDVAMIVEIAHNFGWTLHDYDEHTISLQPAEDEHTADSL